MSLDKATVTGIARLARIRLSDDDLEKLGAELAAILGWVERLEEVDTSDVHPWIGFRAFGRENIEDGRKDIVTGGACPEKILGNAPRSEAGCFVVPRVVE